MSNRIVRDIQGIVQDTMSAAQPAKVVTGTYYREDGRLELDSKRTIPKYAIIRLDHVEFVTDKNNKTEDTMKVVALTSDEGQTFTIIGRVDNTRYCFYDQKESELAREHYKGCHCEACSLSDDREDTQYNGGSSL